MSKKKKNRIQLVKGMKDILPDEQLYWNIIRKKIDNFARNYGFFRIDTPIVEFTNLFKRTVGEDTDVVSKEMYSFVSQGGDKLSLRPENTASIVRSYIEHGMLNLPQPVKLFYVGPQFRHDNPQAGRYRQFWQFGFEAIGDNDPIIDAQLIAISYYLLKELGLDIEVQVNSVGDVNSRNEYIKVLKKYYQDNKKFLCKDCNLRFNKNTLRLLDCKNKKCQELGNDAPQMVDYLSEEGKEHFMSVLEYLDELDIKYTLNPKIVRGLDYYTRTAWEIFDCSSKDGKLNALGGGGRYDDLVESLGGRPTPAVGFAVGIERVVMKMQEAKVPVSKGRGCDIYVAQLGVEARKKSIRLFEELRANGFSVSENMSKKGLKDQLESADKKRAKYTLIMGQKEISDDTILIRDMESGVQEIVDYKKIKMEIKKRLDKHLAKNLKLKK
ncbi:MAG: histidine--tRNA ligase [Candidatus Komeilibacteria bacterium RIFOXYC1_FULL_37_11]|uniref:Histidine--tRNA ligase n=1 Tax=Candidatus Komeilibacteria bacterium RIFOXYC1_FULL_37_11 TaxID=1798555 RepID=A0A1G2BYE7_9BACT|nr:MAG: histidine--tRNA ligase [Candidatus Komeilibacteria bacterium RIFOXYC1_FULL_37_11]OGY95305.1 MAG: histidine--tRNA ligase [Candidatus Komeilibacteria bacterium RIFOXYD1_FULL_37_29]